MASMSDPGRGAFLFCAAEESILARLRENEEQFTDLQLWLNSSSDVPELTHALAQNTSVQEVCLLIHESFVKQPEDGVLALFTVLGQLPQLSKLFFNTYRFPFIATLPVQAFTNIFQGVHRLVEFKLWRTDLGVLSHNKDHHNPSISSQAAATSGGNDLLEWAQIMATNCHNLREFRLIKCRLVATKQDNSGGVASSSPTCPNIGATLDPILYALATLSNLQDVELNASKVGALGSLSPGALEHLLHSSSLQSLSLSNFDLSEEAIVAIAHSLLQPYQFDPPKQKRVQESNTTTSTNQPSTTATTTTTSTPTMCWNSSHWNGSSSCLRHLRLSGVGGTASMFTKPVRDAFRQVLQYNYVLETLFLFDERNLQDEIAFYLKLNRFGRNRLLRYGDYQRNHNNQHYKNSHHDEWIDTLVQVRDDLDCLFYFLSIYPLLCSYHLHGETETDRDNAEEK